MMFKSLASQLSQLIIYGYPAIQFHIKIRLMQSLPEKSQKLSLKSARK